MTSEEKMNALENTTDAKPKEADQEKVVSSKGGLLAALRLIAALDEIQKAELLSRLCPLEGMRSGGNRMSYDYTELAQRIAEHGEAAFIEATGFSKTRLTRLLDNKAKWSAAEIEKARGILDIPPEQVGTLFFAQIDICTT